LVRSLRSLVPLAFVVASAACAARSTSQSATHPPPSTAQVVNATILANGCQSLGQPNAQLAERAMYDLVEGCTSVPGGDARFEATLEPGGRVVISAAPGHADVVPICVLKHALVHRVALSKPCQLDVRLEQTEVGLRSRN
jgi:hypothetical protein